MSSPSNTSAKARESRGGAQCIVLCDPAREPHELIAALRKRGVAATVVGHPMQVMLELARHPARVIVVDQPRQLPRLGELVDALDTYYPQVARWGYRHASNGSTKLERLEGALTPKEPSAATDVAGDSREPTPAERAAMKLRLMDEEPGQALDEAPDTGGPLITRDELEMLLTPVDWEK